MVIAFATLLVVHGLIQLLGVAKAFGGAELPQLAQPISPGFGALWFVSNLLFLAAAVALFIWASSEWRIRHETVCQRHALAANVVIEDP